MPTRDDDALMDAQIDMMVGDACNAGVPHLQHLRVGYTARDFAAVLRQEAVRRVDDRYVHHALIRNEMRDLADRIERWERGEFRACDA